MTKYSSKSLKFALIVLLIAFINYYIGLAPSIVTVFDDSPEFPLVVHRLAIAHPTGYPLYILLAKLFSFFNQNNVAYQLNLFSAICGALAVGGVYLVSLRLWPVTKSHLSQHVGAGLGALIFGLGPIFYSQATIAEVYTLNALFVGVILLLTLQKQWWATAFMVGLSLTHHRTTILLLPAIVVFFIVEYKLYTREGWQQLNFENGRSVGVFSFIDIALKLGIAVISPLLLYLYLPIRGSVGSLDGSYQNTVSGFFRHVLGGGYGAFLFDNPFNHERSAWFYVDLLQNELGWWTLALAVGGVVWLGWKGWWDKLVLTGLAFGVYLVFNLFYQVTDIEVFFIPVFMILAMWSGVALGGLLGWLWQKYWIIASILAGLVLIFILSQQQGKSRANDWEVHDWAVDVLTVADSNAKFNADNYKGSIVGILGEITVLRYFQEVEGVYPDIKTIVADQEEVRLEKVKALLADSETGAVYLTRELSGLADDWSLMAVGPLIQVNVIQMNETPIIVNPTLANTVEVSLTEAIVLVGYQIERPISHQPIAPVRLILMWKVEKPVESNLKISARLLNETGEVMAVVDKVPVHFAYPTTSWQEGAFIQDVYDLNLPPDTPPSNYTPLIIMYDPANNAAEVGRVTLPPLAIK